MNKVKHPIKIERCELSESKIEALFILVPESEVFSGHFPQQPVLPGVLQMQLIRTLLQDNLGETFQLISAPVVKFLSPIVPGPYPNFRVLIQYKWDQDEMVIDADIKSGETVFMKMKGRYAKS